MLSLDDERDHSLKDMSVSRKWLKFKKVWSKFSAHCHWESLLKYSKILLHYLHVETPQWKALTIFKYKDMESK